MGKVDENKHQKEQSLLDSAFELFTTKSLAKTSIADIVERAGMAKGTFYLYFRDKYDIQEKLIARKAEQIFHRAAEQFQGAHFACFSDWLIAFVENIVDQLQEDPHTLRFISKNLSWGVFRRALDKTGEDFLGIIEEALADTGEELENPPLLLYTIVELVGSTCYSVILHGDPVSLAEYKPHLFRAVRAVLEEFLVKKS